MFKDLGIKGRVLLLTLLPTSLLALVLGGYFTWMQLTDLHHQLQQRGEQAVQHLAMLAAPALARSDAAHLKRLAEETLNQPDVRAAGFLNAERKSLAQAGPNMLNPPPQTTAEPLATASGQDATRLLMPVFGRHQRLANGTSPNSADRLLGWVELELSHHRTLLQGYRSLIASLLLSAAGLVIATLLALRLSRTINDPLRTIKQGVSQLKDGHLQTRLPPLDNHEMDELAAGINRMAEALQSAQEELQHSIDQATEDV